MSVNGSAEHSQKFRGMVKTLGALWDQGFRGRVVLDMDGSGSVRLKAEPPSVEITADRVPRMLILSE